MVFGLSDVVLLKPFHSVAYMFATLSLALHYVQGSNEHRRKESCRGRGSMYDEYISRWRGAQRVEIPYIYWRNIVFKKLSLLHVMLEMYEGLPPN